MVRERSFRSFLRPVPALFAIVALTAGYAAFRILEFRDSFVMVTVEESSTSAVVAWPLLAERLPDVFIDGTSGVVMLPRKPNLLGVRLGLYYSAASQGIEVRNSMRFSRSGREMLDLDAPISQVVEGLDGRPAEMVDNAARVLSGDLTVEGTSRDGTVRFRYGNSQFSLGPGESWVEMLALTGSGVRAIDPANWEAEVQSCLANGYPATRLAVTNRGFWPKGGVSAGGCLQ